MVKRQSRWVSIGFGSVVALAAAVLLPSQCQAGMTLSISVKQGNTVIASGVLADNGSVVINGTTFTDTNPNANAITVSGSLDGYTFNVSNSSNQATQTGNQPAIVQKHGTVSNVSAAAGTSITFSSKQTGFPGPGTPGANTPVFLTTIGSVSAMNGVGKVLFESSSMGHQPPGVLLTGVGSGTSQVGPFPEPSNSPPFTIFELDQNFAMGQGVSTTFTGKSIVSLTANPFAIPEPTSIILGALGVPFVFGFGVWRRKRKQMA